MNVQREMTEDGKEFLTLEKTYKDTVDEGTQPVAPKIAEVEEESPVSREDPSPKVSDVEEILESFEELDTPAPTPELNPASVVYEENGAVKYDGLKPRVDLIPPEVIFAMGEMFRHGAEKYDDRNWEKGMKWSRVFGSTIRHLWAWWGGEDIDPESKRPHLYSAACCVAMLVAYRERKIGIDDRPI
jgi:hypothetical protein